jgi:PD-(D/E)XK endonuclease
LTQRGAEEVTQVCRTSYWSGYGPAVVNLSSSGKGAAAEAEIAAALIRLGLVVLRPLCEGGRYDLVLDTGDELVRAQCKWASRTGNVLATRCVTSRHTPSGYRRGTYGAGEIDALAAYAPDTDSCYLIPASEIEGRKQMSLRLAPTPNNQAAGLHWAQDYELQASLERNWNVTVG